MLALLSFAYVMELRSELCIFFLVHFLSFFLFFLCYYKGALNWEIDTPSIKMKITINDPQWYKMAPHFNHISLYLQTLLRRIMDNNAYIKITHRLRKYYYTRCATQVKKVCSKQKEYLRDKDQDKLSRRWLYCNIAQWKTYEISYEQLDNGNRKIIWTRTVMELETPT